MAGRKRRRSPIDQADIGRRIRALRAARHMSQEDLAKHVGIGPPQMNRYEMGNTNIGDLGRAVRIAAALDVSLDYLVHGIESDGTRHPRLNKRLHKLDELTDGQADALATMIDGLVGQKKKRGR